MPASTLQRLKINALSARAGGRNLLSDDITVDVWLDHDDNRRTEPERGPQKALDAPPTGRVGLRSKADLPVLFDEFRVERL